MGKGNEQTKHREPASWDLSKANIAVFLTKQDRIDRLREKLLKLSEKEERSINHLLREAIRDLLIKYNLLSIEGEKGKEENKNA